MSTRPAFHLGMLCPELSGHLNPMTTLGRELQRRGHRVTVVARPDADLDQAALLRFARPRIAGYKLPYAIEIVPELPYLASGKPDRVALAGTARAVDA